MRSPRAVDPNPIQKPSAFAPPPTGVVSIDGLKRETLAYWKTVRVAWLSGFKINWVIPGREGSVTGSRSFWNLDARIQPVEEIIPSRTARYSLEPYVIVAGRPYIEPTLGTRVTVKATVSRPAARGMPRDENPDGLGEPYPELGQDKRFMPHEWFLGPYGDLWEPTPANMGDPETDVYWQASEMNHPRLNESFTYAKRGQWVTQPSMSIHETNYYRLEDLLLGPGHEPVTLFFVAAITAPTKYWASLLRAVEPDGGNPLGVTNLDLRLMPDGNLHPYTWGWQAPLPLIGDRHALSLFGFTLDWESDFLRLFTIDRTFRMAEMKLYYPHSTTSKFVLGRSAEAMFNMDVLDILFYRGPMDAIRTEHIANELDASYGITATNSQEQG